MPSERRDWPPAPGSLRHPGSVPGWGHGGGAQVMVLFGYGGPYSYKHTQKGASSCGCSFSGPQTASGEQKRGPSWCQPSWVSARGKGLQERTSSQGLQKPCCLLPRKRRSFQLLALQLSQQPLFIWLRDFTAHRNVLLGAQRGWPGRWARLPRALPGALRKAAPHPPA